MGIKTRIAAFAALALCAAELGAQSVQVTDRSRLNPGDTIEVVPGQRYEAGFLQTWIIGGEYRDLWTSVIEIPVFDPDSFAGGLTAFKTGGFGQTNTLHLRNPDGVRYTFRSVDKTPARGLPEELRGTLVADVQQDLISALHPGAALVAAPLLEAADVLHVNPRLYVMPYHERLGEFADTFAGMLGYVELRPNEGPDEGPGFAGLTRIVGDDTMDERLEEGPVDRVDAGAFLRARLVDLLLGDRDRHPGQWRWGRVREGERNLWWPIPEDRDQALIVYGGLVMKIVRWFEPKFVSFGYDYPDLAALTFNAWDLDRRFLPELPAFVWDSIAEDVQAHITDSVVDYAVAQMPEPFQRINGDRLGRALRHRRDGLRQVARDYYELYIGYVDITGTDADELYDVEFLPERRVVVSISSSEEGGGTPDEPYYRRVFDGDETNEIRIYLKGGDDTLIARGDGRDTPLVRAIGGGGDDLFADSTAGSIRYYDHRGDNELVSIRDTELDDTDFDRPASSEESHRYALDWGGMRRTLPVMSFQPDVGLILGGRTTKWRYGFRKVPFQTRTTVAAGFATGVVRPSLRYRTHLRSLAHNVHGVVSLEYSGYDIIRFYGFGNETARQGRSSDFFQVNRQVFEFAPSMRFEPHERITLGIGPVLKYSSTRDEVGTRLAEVMPEGIGEYGQVGARVGFSIDARDVPGHPRSGALVEGAAEIYPGLWDVDGALGRLRGSASTYLTPAIAFQPTLALRVGAQRVWGTFPFHEAALLGGADDLRGFSEQRFAGDAAIVGNAELRLGLSDFEILLPGRIGVFGLLDAGRVFLSGEDSSELHSSYGGGVWLSFLSRANTLSIALAHSDERTGVYVRSGFLF